ncbi:MAG: hypothetical protein LBR67_10565 [Dysgonamonadaceae bacterium]|jgi:hypothetical protein|nr:hypothetical protein [Dysgonamonadaceae bacterium]
MKTEIKIMVCGCCLALLTACYEDKGNYDLVDYNKILTVVTNMPSTVAFGDTLKAIPNITWRYPDRDTTDAAFEYKWEAATSTTSEVISSERNLVWVPTKLGALSIYLFITEKATGVVTLQTGSVTVASPYSKGFLILSEKDGKAIMSIVRRPVLNQNNFIAYKDIADIPASSVRARTYPVAYGTAEEVLLTDKEGGTILDGQTFEKTFLFSEDFYGNTFPEGFTFKAMDRCGAADFALSEEGNVYLRINTDGVTMAHTSPFLTTPIYFPGGAKIKDFIPQNTFVTTSSLMFDELNNRLVAAYGAFNSLNSYIGGRIDFVFSVDPATIPAADFRAFGDYKLIYCGQHSNTTSYLMVLKDTRDGKYYIQDFSMSGNFLSRQITNITQYEFVTTAPISDNTIYWRTQLSSYLFFAEGSRLYFYDINTKMTKLYTDFGSARITHLRENPDSKCFGVALDNGDFYIVDASTVSVLADPDPGSVGILFHESGFGSVKYLEWKYGSYYNLLFNNENNY